MTRVATHQTQCPYCQHHFRVTDEELVIKSGYARCTNCGRLFHALGQYPDEVVAALKLQRPTNSSIAASPSSHPPTSTPTTNLAAPSVAVAQPSPETPTAKLSGAPAPASQPHTNEPHASALQTPNQPPVVPDTYTRFADHTTDVADGMLFDDDTGLDDADSADLTDRVTSSAPTTHTSTKPLTGQSVALDFDLVDDFADIPNHTIQGYDGEKTTKAPISDSQDEAWLAKLLESDEDDNPDVSLAARGQSAFKTNRTPVQNSRPVLSNQDFGDMAVPKANEEHVADLLDALGVGTKEATTVSEHDYLRKVNQRLTNTPAATKQHVATQSQGFKAFWAIGCALLMVTLVLQYIIFNLDSMVKKPSTARGLTKVCALLHVDCNLPVANTEAIDARVLAVTATPRNRSQSDLVFTLKNTSASSILYPNLKITLRSGNTPKAQLLMTPAEYVSPNTTQLNAQQLAPIKLRVDYPRRQFEQVNIEMFY